ncbi:MAG TPA: bifunctional demethylmenaquinone methyltransferase/2-methoxy-6-polyprenyl-1,4-benzoquinol methylase UbiE [Polyangiaceae bacterium]|nr:bifunctional demethylmenaquinone methyltransferase/2-methoxy-6-polyprenyl-1,4-benzoquinol methylase UbiE [Polyangiaceae bacterium]
MSSEPTSALTLPPRGGSGEMFDRIAARYDLVNRILSFGVDQRWRTRTVASLELRPGHRVLDLATGTGDLALRVAVRHPDVSVVGLDPSQGMLGIALEKVQRAVLADRIELQLGDAQELPYEAASFDGLCMAFGIRNVPDRARALREMRRVVRPGGRIAILELSEPQGVLGPLARFHVHTLVPRIGALLSGKREYRYLEQSIAAFPPAAEFAELMRSSGLEVLQVIPLTFGVCHLYVATPERSS